MTDFEDQDATVTYDGNHASLTMPKEDASHCARPGASDSAVAFLSLVPMVAEQLAKLDPDAVRSELKETGAWFDSELADDDENRARFVWVAACSAVENES